MRNTKEVNDIVLEIKECLTSFYGAKIKQVIIYGSFARGEATKDSDIDLLVVVDNNLDPRKVEEDLDELLFEILLEKGELVSVIAINESIFNNYKSPLLLNVREEGVIL